MFNKKALTFSLLVVSYLLVMAVKASAGVISVTDGYQINYGIGMNPGSSNGSDIEGVFIFEWNDSNFSAVYGGTIAGTGNTYLSHIIDFDPTMALLMGYGAGIPGVGDEKDHLYTITSLAFSYTVGGLKWSEAFPGIAPGTRVGHNAMINLLGDAVGGSDAALLALEDFVKAEGHRAAFDPRGRFVALEWTICSEGEIEDPPNSGICVPIGGSIPEPASVALFGLGLAGLGWSRGKKA
jgi:PEP-CTERM motif-containing protein